MQRDATVILQPARLHDAPRTRIKRFDRLREAFALQHIDRTALKHLGRISLAIVGKVGDRSKMLVVVVLVFKRQLAA